MQVKSLLVAAATALSALTVGSAYAQPEDHNAWYRALPASDLTRAEVRAEVLAARASGDLVIEGEATAFNPREVASTRSREAVRAEGMASLAGDRYTPYNIGG